ncbi:hypothetical protein BDM02DRAFT_822801 [Thelephora ganbajun]|uniref:Uncharacterized protein n=1 Tax=Thelephora ganbajun TaxID=370292 RepID=A0ACB6Z5U5_THEGA|nr:hypothetical protein BDM02DRAFT_822801 [Thelephora ganbajun]
MGIDATQAHYWRLLRKRVPLAYILVCLDAIKAFAESEKKEAKKRVMTEDDKNLEELMETLDKHSKLLKGTIALQKKLSPSSKLHEGRSVSDLQGAVLEVKAVVESLENIPGSIGTRNQIKRRWDRGWKWIFEKQGGRAKGKKAEKPKLVLDHEDLDLYL